MIRYFSNSAISLAICILLVACGRKGADLSEFTVKVYEPEYAKSFEILGADGMESTLLVSKSPWQGAKPEEQKMLFIARNGELPPADFSGQVLHGDAKRIVVMSSTYIAMLDMLGATDRVKGVSGLGFITNPKVLADKEMVDVGYEGNVDYEKLLAANPDIVLLYGVNGESAMEAKLKELKIPFAYIGEYREESPLGKAEWIMAVAEIAGLRDKGHQEFAKIPEKYNSLRQLAMQADNKPLVMVNTPYADQWVMPSTKSYVAMLIADAGGQYAYTGNNSDLSTPIDMEEAYLLTDNSDVWINTGQISSLGELKQQLPKLADTGPVKNSNVWNTTLTVTPGGGNDYWESGIMHPDLVLRDLIKIFHPELLENEPFSYYKRL